MHGSRNILARCLTLRGRNRRRPRRAFTMLELQVAVLLLAFSVRSEEHTSELQSRSDLVCRLLLEKKKHIHFSLSYSAHCCTLALRLGHPLGTDFGRPNSLPHVFNVARLNLSAPNLRTISSRSSVDISKLI